MSEPLTERELINHVGGWFKEGKQTRDAGGYCPYQGSTLAHYCHAIGWVQRDLQLALIEASPKYAADQARFAKALSADLALDSAEFGNIGADGVQS